MASDTAAIPLQLTYTVRTYSRRLRTTIVLDDKLVARAMKLAGVKTKREAVHVALRAFVRDRLRLDVRRIEVGCSEMTKSISNSKPKA